MFTKIYNSRKFHRVYCYIIIIIIIMINFMNKKYIKDFTVDRPERDNFNFKNLISNNQNQTNVSVFCNK